MRVRCDRRWEADAVRDGTLSEKDADAFQRHLRICEDCSAASAQDGHLRDLARSMPAAEPDELALRRTRARVLRDVATGTRQGRSPVWGAAAVAIASASLIALARVELRAPARSDGAPVSAATPSSTPAFPSANDAIAFASTVSPVAGARWSRSRDRGVERVTLAEGTLAIHVRHQEPGERFLVALPDGELEVRGTTFKVSASPVATESVSVDEGLVALRIAALDDELLLHGGESWTAPAPKGSRSARAPIRVAPSVVVAAGTAAPPAPAPLLADDGTDAYSSAMSLWQHRDYVPAAAAFHAFGLAYPAAAQLEDATFLEAAALARAGRGEEAGIAAERHLSRFPGSFHRRDAAILVARAARDRGDCIHARSVLAPWPADDEARATLQSCAAGDAAAR